MPNSVSKKDSSGAAHKTGENLNKNQNKNSTHQKHSAKNKSSLSGSYAAAGNMAIQHNNLDTKNRSSPLTGLSHSSSLSNEQTQRFAPALGDNVNHIRLFHGAEAEHRTEQLGAKAFTLGQNIVMSQLADQKDLAHEIYHAGRAGKNQNINPGTNFSLGARDDWEEKEADTFADLAQSHAPLPSIETIAGGDKSIRRIPRDDGVPMPQRASSFLYNPERALNVVWPNEDSIAYDVAEELYGNQDLAHELVEVNQNGQRGFQFEPRLLVADWRSVYFEQLAIQNRQQASENGEIISIPGAFLDLEAVVVYLPSNTSGSDYGFNFELSADTEDLVELDVPGFEQAQPAVLLSDWTQPSTYDQETGLPNYLLREEEQGVNPASRYIPQADFGDVVGDLADIVDSPHFHRGTLDQDDDSVVVVRVDPNGPFGHLATARSYYVEPANPNPFHSVLSQPQTTPGFRIGPDGITFDMGMPATQAVLLNDPINISQLDIALTLQQASTDEQDEASIGSSVILLNQQRDVIVLDPTGPQGVRRQGRFLITGGAQAQAMMQQPQAADTYTWNGSSLSPGSVSVEAFQGLTRSDDNQVPIDLQLFREGMRQFDSNMDQSQQIFNLLNNPRDPFAVPQFNLPPRVVYLQTMTVGELRALVRRHSVQSMLRSARNEEGQRIELNRRGLANMVTPEQLVHGTRFDHDVIMDTGELTVRLEADTPEQEGATLNGTLDQFDIALLQMDLLIQQHSRIRDLLTALKDRLISHRENLDSDPSQLPRYASMIHRQIDIAQSSAMALRLIPRLKRRYEGLSRLTRELDEIRDLYGLALAFSDQYSSAQSLYQAADMRMVLFPLLAVQEVGEETNEDIEGVLRHRGDDSWLMGMSVTAQRERMRTLSEDNQASDFRDFRSLLAEARESIRSGDRDSAEGPTDAAADIVERMQSRYRILIQLHQALVAFQHMGNSSAAFTQMFTSNDEKLERLVSQLQGMLRDFENAETAEAQADVMERLGALWESDEAYQAFYEQIYGFISSSDFWVRVGIMVAAGLLTWGAGSAAVGAGWVAAEGIGLLALESAVFTGAHMLGERTVFEHDPNAGLEGYYHPEEETVGDIALDAAGQFAFNFVTFGMAKQVGALGRTLGGRIGMPRAGEMAAVFSMFEGIGVGQFMLEQERLPNAEELLDITSQNAIMLGTMHAAGFVSRPIFEGIQFRVARGVGNYQVQMRVLEARRMRMAEEMQEIGRIARETGQVDNTAMGRLSARAERLAAEAARLQEEMSLDSRIQERAATDPTYARAMEASAARLEAHGDVMAEILFSARAGIRQAGPVSLFNRGMSAEVARFYQERGYDISRSVDENGLVEIRASKEGHTEILRESREAEVGRGFQQGYEEQMALPEQNFNHSGIELHNHLNGVLRSSEIIELFFNGNHSAFLRLIRSEMQRLAAEGRIALDTARLAELEAMSMEGLSARQQAEIRNEIAELRDVQRIMDIVEEGLANPEQAESASENILSASERVKFDQVYDIPRDIVRDSLSPQQYRQWIEASLQRLAADGVSYVELQGKVPIGRGISEAEFIQMCQRAGVEVRFLRIALTTELAEVDPSAFDPARQQAVLDQLIGGQGPPTPVQMELATRLAQRGLSQRGFESLLEGLGEATTVGFDVAGAERGQFTERGMRSFEEMYHILEIASQALGRQFVLRPHVGEGYVPGETRAGEAPPVETGRHNIEMMLTQLETMGYSRDSGVIIRLGHVTHATPEQIARMADLGVIAEANIMSNIATGAISQAGPNGAIQGHPLLQLLYSEVPVVFKLLMREG